MIFVTLCMLTAFLVGLTAGAIVQERSDTKRRHNFCDCNQGRITCACKK